MAELLSLECAFLKRFGSSETEKVPLSELYVSSYLPVPLRNILETLTEELYIICPVYDELKIGNRVEIQLGITGSTYVNEDPIQGIMREISEESGLLIEPSELIAQEPIYVNTRTKSVLWHTFTINISHTYLNTQAKRIEGSDNYNVKVGAVIYGEIEQMRELFNAKLIKNYSEDNIDGIMIVPAFFVLEALRKLSNRNPYYRPKMRENGNGEYKRESIMREQSSYKPSTIRRYEQEWVKKENTPPENKSEATSAKETPLERLLRQQESARRNPQFSETALSQQRGREEALKWRRPLAPLKQQFVQQKQLSHLQERPLQREESSRRGETSLQRLLREQEQRGSWQRGREEPRNWRRRETND